MTTLNRKDVTGAFPGRKVTFRKVSFADLARGEAYRLTVSGVNDGGDVLTAEQAAIRAPLLERLLAIVAGKLFKGVKVIA